MPEITGGGIASPIVKAVLDALGVSYVVEQGSDENGNWWRRFSNGWVEQGGPVKSAVQTTIVFPIPFVNTDYFLAISQVGWAVGDPGSWAPRELHGTRTVSSVDVWVNSDSGFEVKGHWEVKGFAA